MKFEMDENARDVLLSFATVIGVLVVAIAILIYEGKI